MTAIALDTNLLLLLIVGQATGQVAGKRLKAFSDDDFVVLEDRVSKHDRLISTPNVWTELSNTWDWGLDGRWRDDVLERMLLSITNTLEIMRPSKEVISDPEFSRLGLADCVWLAVLDPSMTLLTDDVALCNIATSRGHNAVNFTNLRNFE